MHNNTHKLSLLTYKKDFKWCLIIRAAADDGREITPLIINGAGDREHLVGDETIVNIL